MNYRYAPAPPLDGSVDLPSQSINDWPRITIVTPSYNQAAYLEETIQSVLLQAYPNLEYIIIDGGSKDGSVEIIKRYESWLTFWCSEPDKGQSCAINKGWKMGTGEIFAWLNSDDVYKPETLKRVASIFLEDGNLDIVYGDLNVIDESGRLKEVAKYGEKDLAKLLSGECLGQPSTFISRNAVVRSGYLNEDLHLCMDYDLWLKIIASKNIRYLPQVLASFRIHGESKTSRQMIEMLAEQLDVAMNFAHKNFAQDDAIVGEVAKFKLYVGVKFLESGLDQEARAYIGKGVSELKGRLREKDVLMIASSFVRVYGRSAPSEMKALFSGSSELANIGKKAESWVYALLSYDGRWGNRQSLSDAFQALARIPNKEIFLAVKAPILKAFVGPWLSSVIRKMIHSR